MFSTVTVNKVNAKESYSDNLDDSQEFDFIENDTTFRSEAGVTAVANAQMVARKKLDRGSHIQRANRIYRVVAINRGWAGASRYLLKEVGKL